MRYDLLLKDGTLVDSAEGIHGRRDVAFSEGRVAAVGTDLPRREAAEVMDCTNRIGASGMIDLHVHVFWGVSH